jgi:hypothetical protein
MNSLSVCIALSLGPFGWGLRLVRRRTALDEADVQPGSGGGGPEIGPATRKQMVGHARCVSGRLVSSPRSRPIIREQSQSLLVPLFCMSSTLLPRDERVRPAGSGEQSAEMDRWPPRSVLTAPLVIVRSVESRLVAGQ